MVAIIGKRKVAKGGRNGRPVPKAGLKTRLGKVGKIIRCNRTERENPKRDRRKLRKKCTLSRTEASEIRVVQKRLLQIKVWGGKKDNGKAVAKFLNMGEGHTCKEGGLSNVQEKSGDRRKLG